MVRSDCCSSRRPDFSFQHPSPTHNCTLLQLGKRNLTASSGFQGHCTHIPIPCPHILIIKNSQNQKHCLSSWKKDTQQLELGDMKTGPSMHTKICKIQSRLLINGISRVMRWKSYICWFVCGNVLFLMKHLDQMVRTHLFTEKFGFSFIVQSEYWKPYYPIFCKVLLHLADGLLSQCKPRYTADRNYLSKSWVIKIDLNNLIDKLGVCPKYSNYFDLICDCMINVILQYTSQQNGQTPRQ